MKKVVIKLASIDDSKIRQKAFKAAAGMEGVESVSIDIKDYKITVIGDVDPVAITMRLRKFGGTELLSVGPAKEEKKDDKKKEDNPKKDEKKASPPPPTVVYYEPHWSSYPTPVMYCGDDRYESRECCSIC